MDSYNKYLKYKKKYLSLKDILTYSMNSDKPINLSEQSKKKKYLSLKEQLGGAKCPVKGFQQHKGECWHDSVATILLFNDEISEHIQYFFDSNVHFDVEHCIIEAMKDLTLLPLNITEDRY